MTKSRLIAAVTTAAILAGGTGTALAQQQGDVTITVGPKTVLAAGDTAPFDAAGVRAIRRGQPIPNGYQVIGRKISGYSGGVGAAIRFTCPDGKRLKTFGTTGRAGFLADREYVNHRQTTIISIGRTGDSGTIYAVCR
jgi:hypothetical protein